VRVALRTLLVAIGGYAITAAAALLGALAAGVFFPQSAGAPPTTPYLSIGVAAGFLGAVAGGYFCARRAPENRRLIAVVLLLLLFMGMAVAMRRLHLTGAREPFGFLPLVTLLGVIGAWAGAMVERAVHARPTSRAPSP
jgi:uncharacterized membrane protein YhaH (DUF805 family)